MPNNILDSDNVIRHSLLYIVISGMTGDIRKIIFRALDKINEAFYQSGEMFINFIYFIVRPGRAPDVA